MNSLTLAVAGGRKTQSIAEHCASSPDERRILVLTYTRANQAELAERLAGLRPKASIDIQGWFQFLLRHCIRPYLPMKFAGRRLTGFIFDDTDGGEGDPGQYAKGESRLLSADGRAFRRHLSKLAVEVIDASGQRVLDRLGRIYDEIHIDEVQDLNGFDLDIVHALMESELELSMVGDVRQAILQTNVRDRRHKQFQGMNIKKWFDERAEDGLLEVEHQATTWRCNPKIAEFADSIFEDALGFKPTISVNQETTGHDGLFVLALTDVVAYYRALTPLPLRHSKASAKTLDLPFTNFRLAKGLTADRVLIVPTGPQREFLERGAVPGPAACCSLYVAVTRARYSAAFAVPDPSAIDVPTWSVQRNGAAERCDTV